MREKILEAYTKCLEKAKSKQKFVELEQVAIECTREVNQLIMQGVLNSKGNGHQGKEIILEDGRKAKFKEMIKKK